MGHRCGPTWIISGASETMPKVGVGPGPFLPAVGLGFFLELNWAPSCTRMLCSNLDGIELGTYSIIPASLILMQKGMSWV